MPTTSASRPVRAPGSTRRSAAVDAALKSVLDGALEVGVVAFASWTVLFHAASALDARPSAMLAVWVVLVAILVVVRVLPQVRRAVPVIGGRGGHVAASLLALGSAVLASFLVRPDLDDASYVARSTWVAQRDDLGLKDIMFSQGEWKPLVGQDPYLPSIETLLGAIARVTGVQAGSVVYLVWVPLVTAAAVWALWMLLRAWRLRSPLSALVLALVFLLWGGSIHASWGNLHLGRIWQGKVVLLALVVPLAYAWCAAYWRSTPGRRRRSALLLVASVGVAGVGLSPAGVFVLPLVGAVGAVAGVVARRPGRALALVIVASAYPLVAGAATRLLGNLGTAEVVVGAVVNPWLRTLGQGLPALVVLIAAVAALLGVLRPRVSGIGSPVARITAASSVVVGLVMGLPPVYDLLAQVMGTEAIAWRAVWVVPVPALVAALASPLPSLGRVAPLTGVAAAATLVIGGLPLWSAANGAALGHQPRWKLPTFDLATARWLTDDAPRDGLYLAREGVVVATGVMSSDLRPVGSRADYLAQYAGEPQAKVPERSALQAWANGAAGTGDPATVQGLLDELDVRVVCTTGDRAAELGPAWSQVARTELDTCWVRD